MKERNTLFVLLGAIAGAVGFERYMLKMTNKAFGSEQHQYGSMLEFLYASAALRRSTEMVYQNLLEEQTGVDSEVVVDEDTPGQYL